MAAITWRSLTGADSLGPAAVLTRAGDTLNQGFNIFDRVLQREQSANTSREDTANNAAMQSYLNMIHGAGSAQDLEALKSTGALTSAFAALDPKIQAQVRGADETRAASLRDQFLKGQQFNMDKAKWEALPTTDKIGVLATQGKYDDANGLVEQLPEGLRAQYAKVITDAKVASEDRTQKANLTASQIRQNDGSANLNNAQAGQVGVATETARERLSGIKAEEADKAAARTAENIVGPLIAAHLQKKTTDSGYTVSDTDAIKAAINAAREKGTPDRILAQLEPGFRSRIDSFARGSAPAGADARAAAAGKAGAIADENKFMDTSVAGGELVNSFSGMSTVNKLIEDGVKNATIPKEASNEIRAKLAELSKNGVRGPDGNRYPLTLNAVQRALTLAEDSGLWFNLTTNMDDSFETLVRDMYHQKDPTLGNIADQFKAREKIDLDRRKRLQAEAFAGGGSKN